VEGLEIPRCTSIKCKRLCLAQTYLGTGLGGNGECLVRLLVGWKTYAVSHSGVDYLRNRCVGKRDAERGRGNDAWFIGEKCGGVEKNRKRRGFTNFTVGAGVQYLLAR